MCVCLAESSLSPARGMYSGVPQADVMRDRLTAPALAVTNSLCCTLQLNTLRAGRRYLFFYLADLILPIHFILKKKRDLIAVFFFFIQLYNSISTSTSCKNRACD